MGKLEGVTGGGLEQAVFAQQKRFAPAHVARMVVFSTNGAKNKNNWPTAENLNHSSTSSANA
jgi:hypothetical protein